MKMANAFTSRVVINIKDLLKVHRVDKQRVEFNASWKKGKWQILRSITAFGNDLRNDNGGYIIIGVEPLEDGKVKVHGVPHKNLDKIQQQIQFLCEENISPPYYPILSPEIYTGKLILVIWATASENGPHACRERLEGVFQFYIRRGRHTVRASQDERTQLILQHSKTPFDDRMARHPGKKSLLYSDRLSSGFFSRLRCGRDIA